MKVMFRFTSTAIVLDLLELAVSRMICGNTYNIVPLQGAVWAAGVKDSSTGRLAGTTRATARASR